MSSGAGAAGGVGGLDLNCEASPALHNHGTCVEDPPVNTGSGVLERERGGDEKKVCERGLADREDGMVSDGEGSGGSDIEGESEVGVEGSVTREAGAESHVGEILEVDLRDKGIIELAVLSTEGLLAVEASSQPIDLVDESVDDQERGTDVNTEGVVGNDEDSLAVLSGDGGDAGECLEGSSFLRKEEFEVQAGLVDGGGQVVDGKLGLEELKTDVDSQGAVLLEVVTGESESSDLVVGLAEEFEVVDTGNQPMILEDGSIDDHKQGSDDQLTHRGSEPEVKFHNSNFLETEERSSILVTVSTKGFKPVEASSHAMEFQDGSCGDQKEGTNFDAEGMVIDDALIPTKEEDEVASLGAKVSEVNRGEKESTKLVVVSAEGFGPVKRSSQPTDLACESDIVQLLGTDLDANGTVKVNDFSVSSSVASREELVAVSTEVFEPVKAISQAIDLADGSADVPVFGTELDEKGRVGIHDDSVSNCASVGVKMLELGRVERVIAELDSSTEVFEPIQASSQAIDLSDGSGDIQMRVTDAYANDTIRISEDSVRISSELFEPVKSSSQDIDLGDEFADVERRGTDLEAEILELEREEKEGAETEVFELDNTSTQAKDLGDGCGDDQRLGTVIEAVVGIGNNEDSVAISVDNGGSEDKIQGNLGDGRIQIVDGELGTGKREEKVKSFGDGCMEVDMKEKGIPELGDAGGMDLGDGCAGDVVQCADVGIKGIARTDDSLVVLASGGAVGGESSERSLILRGWVDVQVDLLDDGSQLCPGERESEFESHGGVLSIVGPREMERSDLVSVSAEEFEDNESNDRAVNLGDGSFGDQKLEIDVDADVLVVDGQLGPGERDTKLKSFSGDGFDGDQKGGTLVMDSELGREDEHQSHGRNFLEVDSGERGSAEAMVTTTEEFAVISAVSGGPEDETLEESLVLRKEQIDVQGDFVDGSSQVGHGELGDSELIRHGEVDMGEKESTKLVSSSAEWPVVVEASSQAMDVGDGSDSDKKPETDKDTDDVGNEDSVTAGVPEHLVDGCCQVVDSEEGPGGKENELESHDGKLVAVLGEKAKEMIAFSAEKFEAVEVSGQAMDLGDESNGDQTQGVDVNAKDTIVASDDSAAVSAGGGVSENERLEESSVFRIEPPVEVLRKLVHGCGQVADGELINGERLHVVESDDEKLLKVETEEEGSAELFAISAERAEAVETSQAIDMKDGSGGDQKPGTDVDAKFMFGNNEDSVNESLEGTLLFGDELIEAQEDLVDGDDQVLNDVFSLGIGEGEVDRHSEILLEMDAEEIRSTELASVSVVASSQDMDLEDGYSSDKKHDSSIVSESVVRIDEDHITVSVNSGGPEVDLLEGSFNFVKEDVEFGDDTNGTGAAVENLAQPMNNKDIGVDTLVHATQFRTEYGDGGPDDVKFGENQIVDEEAVTQPGLSETKFAHPEKIGSGEIDVMRNAGHVNDTVNSEHAENRSSREGFNGDNMSESCVEADADQLVSHISCQGTEAQELEGAKKSDCEQVEIKYSGDGSQMMGKFDQIQKNGDPLNVDVNEGDPHEREGELVGNDGHSQSEVISEFSAGGESMDHQPLDQTVVTDSLGTFQSTVLELMGGETVRPHHSTVDSNPVEVRTDASSGENDQKIYDEKDTVAGELVQKLDNTVEKVEVLVDNGLVKSAMPTELQNASAHKNSDYQNQKEDSSSTMVSFREEEHAADPHLLGNFFIEKEHSIMEDSISIFGISMPEGSAESDNPIVTMQLNESSVGYRDVRPPNAEFEHGQSLQDGNCEHLKESDNQIQGCGDTSIETLTSRQASYDLSFPEKEGFSTSDLVWGKVKSHPWWPGQIFDFSGASKLALKYQKKDHFLVAYFGDKTFAWCEESRLKPFQLNFSQMEKQTSSDTFSRALHDILVEISRRIELSMTCLCLPEETYADIEYQKVENAGVRGKTVNSVFDRYEIVNYFRPDKLLEYVSGLALLPTGGADRLELTVAQAQLKAFYLSKGYTELPSFINGSGLLENDFEIPISMSRSMNEDDLDHSATLKDLFSTKGKSRLRDGTLGKQKLIVKDGWKQKSLSELMEEEKTYAIVNGNKNASEVRDDERQLSSGNKRKSVGLFSMDTERIKMKKTVSQVDKGTTLSSPIFNRSFKVGEFISRAASKLTCGRPLRKCHDEKADDWTNNYMDIDEFLDVPFDSPKLQIDISEDYPPASDLLSKLCLAARNPLKGYNFSSIVISFFSAFRNLQVSNFIEMSKTEKPRAKRGRKKKIIPDLELSDTSTPDHMKDSYWSDMIVPEKDAMSNPPKRRGRKKKKFIEDTSVFQVLNSPSDCESKLHIGSGCPHGKHILMAERPIITVEEKFVDERTPTAVILYFNSSDSLPSDTDLIRIFSRYGPLKEEETSVETKTNSAMVVFKKRADAEMAFSSAGKIGTFGPALLSYRLRHFPAKSAPVNTVEGEDDPPPTTDGDSRILAELESVSASDGKGCENFPPVRSEDVDIDSSYFNQPRMDAVSIRVETGGADEFSDPPRDAPVQTQTGIVSENLLLESVDQEFSYFDLEFAESGVVSGNMQIETVCPPESGGKSSDFLLDKAKILQVSHEEIPSQLAMGISESLPDQSERAAEISDESSVAVDVLPSPLVSDSAHF